MVSLGYGCLSADNRLMSVSADPFPEPVSEGAEPKTVGLVKTGGATLSWLHDLTEQSAPTAALGKPYPKRNPTTG